MIQYFNIPPANRRNEKRPSRAEKSILIKPHTRNPFIEPDTKEASHKLNNYFIKTAIHIEERSQKPSKFVDFSSSTRGVFYTQKYNTYTVWACSPTSYLALSLFSDLRRYLVSYLAAFYCPLFLKGWVNASVLEMRRYCRGGVQFLRVDAFRRVDLSVSFKDVVFFLENIFGMVKYNLTSIGKFHVSIAIAVQFSNSAPSNVLCRCASVAKLSASDRRDLK